MRLHLVRHGHARLGAPRARRPPAASGHRRARRGRRPAESADRPDGAGTPPAPDLRDAAAGVVAVRRISTSALILSAAELAERVGHPASLPRLTPLQSGQAAVARHDVHIERVWPMRSPSTGPLGGSSSASSRSDRRGAPPARIVPVEGLRMSQAFPHEPVMAAEVVDLLGRRSRRGWCSTPPSVGPATPGALLEANPGITLLGLDRDPIAVAAATGELAVFGQPGGHPPGPLRLAGRRGPAGPGRARNARGPAGPDRRPLRPRRQLTPARRGRARASPTGGTPRSTCAWTRRSVGPAPTSSTRSDEDTLVQLFADNGETRFARRIARAIIAARPITTTGQLADVVRDAIPAATRRTGGHPARRVFQAIRIAVNEELDQLHTGLDAALDLLRPGGRCVVISYHSGEDRLVKATFTRPPPTTATARPACPACAAPIRSSAWSSGAPAGPPTRRSPGTAGPRPPDSGSSSASRRAGRHLHER